MKISDFLIVLSIVATILLMVILLPLTIMLGIDSPNNGSHTGYITAVEKSGLIFRVNSVYVKTDTQSSQEDKYCASNEIIEELKQAQIEKRLITVEYKRGLIMPMWECRIDTETKIINVK